jgi:hypothetical protein
MHPAPSVLAVAQREFGLRLNHGERRFQLMRGVREKAPPRQLHALRASDVLVDRIDKRRDLARQTDGLKRCGIVVGTRRHFCRQAV